MRDWGLPLGPWTRVLVPPRLTLWRAASHSLAPLFRGWCEVRWGTVLPCAPSAQPKAVAQDS
jgi:hypothetical protein